MAIDIKPLTPQLLPGWLNFFDNTAFADNPDWANCYCCCYQLKCTSVEWGKRTKEQNRLSALELIKAGKMKGYLAFENELPVGWCNVNEAGMFRGIMSSTDFASLPRNNKTAAVICFIISHTHRGKGIARMLLRQAVKDCSKQGYEFMEAYPRTGKQLSSASQFHGPLSLYLSEGFAHIKDFEKYAVVRKEMRQKGDSH